MKFSRYALPFLALLSTLPAQAREDADDPDEPAAQASPASSNSTESQSATRVQLSAEQRRAAGLRVEPLQAAALQPETAAYGKALDIQPLLELRSRHRAARSDAEVAAAALELARKNRERLSALHREEIVAGRDLVQAEAQWQSDRAREAAAQRLVGEIRREALQAWGAELARLALDGDAALFKDLLSHRRALLLIALPQGQAMPSKAPPLRVARNPERAEAARAEPISPANRTDELVQGETWFYQTAASGLRSGMRVYAWLPLPGEKLNGVAIPLSAVVWHAGKPWVFRETGGESFARVEVADYRDHEGGWFAASGFAPGERIVVTGAQTLLSEEFRQQIPDEDDD